MASLNLAGKTSGYVKVTAPDDSSTNPTVVLPKESGELALKSDIGGGGGDYTPEKMVWEDKLAEREFATTYTNTNDVPLYISVNFRTSDTKAQSYVSLVVDGETQTTVGSGSTLTNTNLDIFYVIPSGSTYKLGEREAGINTLTRWHEAKMPLAVGIGGKTVAFRGSMTSNLTGLTSGEPAKVNIDRFTDDTDNALVDGKFKPSVAGWYQVNGAIAQGCSPSSTKTVSYIYKNGEMVASGTNNECKTGFVGSVSDIVYLDGKDDYIELWGVVVSSGTCAIVSNRMSTFLSAVLVSGGSASGDSATLESLGIPNHDKIEVSENGNTKFTKPVTIRNEGGEALRFERTGYDVMDLNLSESGFRVRNVTKSTTPVLLLNDSLNTTHDMKVNGVTVGTGGGNVNTNTVLGKGALNKNALGNSNTVIGTDALYNNEGNGNIAIGYRAGNNMTNSSNNILIGDSVQASTLTTSNEVTIGNDAVTKTRLKGDVQTTKKDKKLTIDANVGELGLKSRITTDASILELKAGSGGLPDVTISDTEINLGSDTVTTTRLKGSLFAQGVWNDTASVGETPNVCVGNDGKLFRSLTTTYTTEEVDKKLAIKDKLIEKLSDRLDKLEKKLKKAK